MINSYLINPKSIALIGASNDETKPGGKALKNLLSTNFQGKIYPVNPKESTVQGLICYKILVISPTASLLFWRFQQNL